jgi:hypothetical protein
LLRDFAGDLPEAKAKDSNAVQEPFHKALLVGKTTHAAWRSKPSFYAVCTEDRTINLDLERFMAKRTGAQEHRSEGESPVADILTRRDHPVDPGSRRTPA